MRHLFLEKREFNEWFYNVSDPKVDPRPKSFA